VNDRAHLQPQWSRQHFQDLLASRLCGDAKGYLTIKPTCRWGFSKSWAPLTFGPHVVAPHCSIALCCNKATYNERTLCRHPSKPNACTQHQPHGHHTKAQQAVVKPLRSTLPHPYAGSCMVSFDDDQCWGPKSLSDRAGPNTFTVLQPGAV